MPCCYVVRVCSECSLMFPQKKSVLAPSAQFFERILRRLTEPQISISEPAQMSFFTRTNESGWVITPRASVKFGTYSVRQQWPIPGHEFSIPSHNILLDFRARCKKTLLCLLSHMSPNVSSWEWFPKSGRSVVMLGSCVSLFLTTDKLSLQDRVVWGWP